MGQLGATWADYRSAATGANPAFDRVIEVGIVKVTDGRIDSSPTFSPNGRMILLATVIGGRGVLSAVSSDGRVKQRLSVQAGDVREPAWGPYPKN